MLKYRWATSCCRVIFSNNVNSQLCLYVFTVKSSADLNGGKDLKLAGFGLFKKQITCSNCTSS